MALFRQFRGKRADLDAQEMHDGYAYFCTDDGTFHIDFVDANGVLQRKQVNAKEAESLIGYDIVTILNSNDDEIPTSGAIVSALEAAIADAKADASNKDAVVLVEITAAVKQHNTDKAALEAEISKKANDDKVDAISELVGDTKVSEQINNAVAEIKPKCTSIILPANAWTGDSNPWSQVVTMNSVTANSKIDLQPTALQIVELQNNDIALIAENDNGVVTVYALGNKPTVDYSMQALITEVAVV